MKLTNSFEVDAPPERVWDFLLDLERVTPCMPGAELSDLPDERTWKGKVNIKLGAVTLSYAANVVIDEKDEASHTVTLKANGQRRTGRAWLRRRSTRVFSPVRTAAAKWSSTRI